MDFASLRQEKWSMDSSIVVSLQKLSQELKLWNKNVFGNNFQHKRKLLRRLEGVQRNLAQRTTLGLLKLEEKLIPELNETLRHEEILWMQKSRIQWLWLGDRNTRFFHTSTLIRR